MLEALKCVLVRALTKQRLNPLSLSLFSSSCFHAPIPSLSTHVLPFNSLPIHPTSLHYFHGKLFGALRAGRHCTQLTLSFSNQDGGLVEEPTTSPFLPSPSLKLPLSNSALPNQALGGIASGLGMQNLNSSRQVRLLGKSREWSAFLLLTFLTW